MAGHSLVVRALDIIDHLADQPDGSSVTAVAESLKMPASAAHRLLGLLVQKQMVEQDERTRDYRLTIRFPAIGLRYLSRLSFIDACRPVMDALARDTRELVRLTVVSGSDLLWIAKAQGSRSSLRLDPLEGRSAILHVTAAGKAWLSTMDREQAAKHFSALRRRGSNDFGPNAHADLDKFLADLDLCRRRGFATTYEEAEPGVVAVGAVIQNGARAAAEVVGTISVAGPSARLRRKDLEPLGRLVKAAAGALSAIWPATTHVFDSGPTGESAVAQRN